MFFLIYALLFALFIYLLNKKIQSGPYADKFIESRPHQQDMAKMFNRGEQ
jgi:cytochrome d ubiquinol oxidase subunit I